MVPPDSDGERAAQQPPECLHLRVGHAAQAAFDHRLLDGAQDTRDDHGGDDQVLSTAIVTGGADHQDRTDLSSRFLRKNEGDEDDIAATEAGRTLRLGDCSRAGPGPDLSAMS